MDINRFVALVQTFTLPVALGCLGSTQVRARTPTCQGAPTLILMYCIRGMLYKSMHCRAPLDMSYCALITPHRLHAPWLHFCRLVRTCASSQQHLCGYHSMRVVVLMSRCQSDVLCPAATAALQLLECRRANVKHVLHVFEEAHKGGTS